MECQKGTNTTVNGISGGEIASVKEGHVKVIACCFRKVPNSNAFPSISYYPFSVTLSGLTTKTWRSEQLVVLCSKVHSRFRRLNEVLLKN